MPINIGHSGDGDTDVRRMPTRMVWIKSGNLIIGRADFSLRLANERRRYFETTSLIDWAQT